MALQQETLWSLTGNTEALRRPEASSPEWRQMVSALTLWCSTWVSALTLLRSPPVSGHYRVCLTSGKPVEEVSGSGVPPPSRWRGDESLNALTPPQAPATLNDHSSKVGHDERKGLSRNTFVPHELQLGFSPPWCLWSSDRNLTTWLRLRIMMWLAAGYQSCLWPDTWQQEGDAWNTRSSRSLL